MALYSGLLKTIDHLARAILNVLVGDVQAGKAYFFSSIRDLQEALGWITTLFNDRKGSYLVMTAQFWKSCYDIKVRDVTGNNPLLPPFEVLTGTELNLNDNTQQADSRPESENL